MSEDADESSKTEEPTQKKLDEAHKKGQFPLSKEIDTWMSLAVVLVILIAFVPGIMSKTMSRLTFYVEEVWQIPMDRGGVGQVLLRVLADIVMPLWFPMLMLMAAALLASIVQKGWTVSWEIIKPKFNKLDPISGFKRLLSLGSQSVELLKGIAKMAVVGVVTWLALLPMVETVEHYAGIDILQLLREMDDLTINLLVGVVLILTVIAAADTAWQRYQYNKKMKMTKHEVKEEHKQAEGDPQVKARIRGIRLERARQRMMANVPKSDVVVTNPTHYAIALKYDPGGMGAPMCLAKGIDAIALNIRKVAEENDIPIVENPPLARALYDTVEIDEEIPSEHYRAVAEVITYVFKLKGRSLRG